MLSRRGFLGALGAALAVPAVLMGNDGEKRGETRKLDEKLSFSEGNDGESPAPEPDLWFRGKPVFVTNDTYVAWKSAIEKHQVATLENLAEAMSRSLYGV